MKRTYLDACVLIAAAVLDNPNDMSKKALAILTDPGRFFISSEYVKLEVIPHAMRNKRQLEVDFYNAFFDEVGEWVESKDELLQCASELIVNNNGLSGIDAIHVAAALLGGADELITAERKEKPICNVKCIKVITIRD